MARRKVSETLKVGDRVQIHNYGINPGRIVELRGPLGPEGMQVYRVRVGRKPKPIYLEVLEDEMSLIPTKV